MGTLPSGYISADWIGGANCYFDTGFVTSNTLNITGLFYLNPNASATYVFGARNTQSNTAAGQLNFLHSGSGTSYIGYQSARLTLNENPARFLTYIQNKSNVFTVISGDNTSIFEKTGSTAAFTGTRTMLLLALHDANAVNYGTNGTSYYAHMKAFKVEDNGVLIHEYAPCYDETNQVFGLYDFVDQTMLLNQGTGTFDTMYLLDVSASTGGTAYIKTENAGYVSKQYRWKTSTEDPQSPCIAVAKRGYEFLNWTNGNGDVVSTDEIYYPIISEDTVLTANFIEVSEKKQENRYQLLGLQYGIGSISSAGDANGSDSNIYTFVNDFICREDTLSESTTTIEVDSVPSLFQINIPVFLISPKGKVLWCGIIESIDENIITCREATALYDMDIICVPSNSVDGDNLTNRTVLYGAWIYYIFRLQYANNNTNTNSNPFITRMLKTLHSDYDRRVYFDNSKNIDASFPLLTEKEIQNSEGKLMELFSQFGVVVRPYLYKEMNSSYPAKGYKNLLGLSMDNPRKYDPITIGTNSECITDVNVVIENQNSTTLMVFNSTGTFRGEYGVENDGVISEFNASSNTQNYIAYTELNNKVVLSDDKISTLIKQHLGNAFYNHKITFNVDLTNGEYRFGDFIIGRYVNFYVGDKLYKSFITGKEFSYSKNTNGIDNIKITLGNVRTALTIKLNQGKAGKKK